MSNETTMTPEQHRHVHKLMAKTSLLMEKKYTAGALEHGGNIWNLSPETLLDNAIDEAVDQVVYLLTQKQVLKDDTSRNQ
jgi:hypothetical protein